MKLVRLNNYDVIVTSLYRASIISRAVSLLTQVPLVDTIVNDSYGKYKKQEFKGIHRIKFYIVLLLDRLTSGIPKLWISNAEYIAGSMAKVLSIDKRKIKIIHRGRRVQEMYAWNTPALGSPFHFISIGRLSPQKGQADLIRAFHQFHQKYPGSRLTIYGDGLLKKDLEQLISELKLNNIIFLPGRTPEAWKQMYQAHCFILPSYYEGFSGALIEALILGIPLICSDIPMNREAVKDSENGLLYKVGEIDQLLQSMTKLYEQYQESIERGKTARKEALVNYDIKSIAQQYQEAITIFATPSTPRHPDTATP